MKKIVVSVLFLCGLVAMAENLVIQSFDGNGRVIFNELPYVSDYYLEQAPSLMGSWEQIGTNLPHTGTGSITSSVPVTASAMFFRVAMTPRPIPEGMVEILAGTNSGINPDAELGDYSLTVDTFCMDEEEVSKGQWNDIYDWADLNGYLLTTREMERPRTTPW